MWLVGKPSSPQVFGLQFPVPVTIIVQLILTLTFLSAFQVVADVGEVDYEFDSPVVTHFCFPTNGYAVADRNGDVLLFHP